MKRVYPFFLVLLISLSVFGDIPTGYYNSATGLSGAQLKTALYNIIKGHTRKSYDYLWTAFYTTDDKPNGTVWDMYSDIPDGTANGNPPYVYYFGTDQCSNTPGYENGCYNREHSFPNSWFGGVTTSDMYTDLFHLYPADSYVNSRRNNYPYAKVGTATWTSQNGSKLGPCVSPGYTGTVFEPRDEYKGDLARSYFYMATRYENVIATWETMDSEGDKVLDGTSYPCFETWYIDLLLSWNAADPVSQKEIDRNNTIYGIQNNRNPFIDHPEYAQAIWGSGVVLPVPTITGPSTVCANSTSNVYTTQTGMTNYIWTVSSGGTITSGGTSSSNTVTVTWNTSGARSVSVNYTNASGYSAATATVYNVTVNALPTPTISGPAIAYVNSTGNVYSTQSGMTNYVWTVSSGGTITSGGTSSSNSVTVTWTTSGSKTVSVNYTNSNACSATSATVYTVTVTLQEEPSNYPTNFSAHNIILHWTDVTSGSLPTGYLIRMSSTGYNAIPDPVDGVPVANSSTDLNVAYGIQQAWFGNLQPNTTYYFKMYSYSGSGNFINYKIDSPPQVQAATLQ